MHQRLGETRVTLKTCLLINSAHEGGKVNLLTDVMSSRDSFSTDPGLRVSSCQWALIPCHDVPYNHLARVRFIRHSSSFRHAIASCRQLQLKISNDCANRHTCYWLLLTCKIVSYCKKPLSSLGPWLCFTVTRCAQLSTRWNCGKHPVDKHTICVC